MEGDRRDFETLSMAHIRLSPYFRHDEAQEKKSIGPSATLKSLNILQNLKLSACS
jgi:hypothetical protein